MTEKALDEHPEEVTEQQIGVHVFGRPAGYDSGSDNVVRSQARQLRMRLEQYFATEGSTEPAAIVIPKGTYLPSFVERAAAAAAPIAQPDTKPRQRTLMGVAVLAAVLGLVCVGEAIALRRTSAGEQRGPSGALGELWSGIFKKGEEVFLIVPDHTYGAVQASAHRNIGLSEYLGEQYGAAAKEMASQSGLSRSLPGFSDLHLTGLYAVTDVARINSLQRSGTEPLKVRWPRDLNMRDLNTGNVILIGNRNVNPWVELFENNLNFDFRWDPESDYNYCVNRSPKPGEPSQYKPTVSGDTRVAYGGIAYVPSPQRHGSVLLILGTSMAGSEIAAEFVTNEQLSGSILDRLKAQAGGKLPYFEILLRTTSIASQAGRVEVVSSRTIPD